MSDLFIPFFVVSTYFDALIQSNAIERNTFAKFFKVGYTTMGATRSDSNQSRDYANDSVTGCNS